MPSNPWDQRYARPDHFYGTEPNDFLRAESARLPAGSDVLCLGEGEGRNAVFLASLGHRVTGVDGSAEGLAKARRLADSRGVAIETAVADLAEYDMGEARWGAIVSIFCHLPPGLRADVHRRAARALRPGGLFLLEAYRPEQLDYKTGGPPDVALLPTLAGLREELAGLELVEARDVLREIHEGPGHDGMSATVQVIARRPGG